MKTFDEHGKQMGEIEKPGPIKQGGVWYEATEYRAPKKNEAYLSLDGVDVLAWSDSPQEGERWIMRPIPAPTPEQLKAIGMKLDGDRPRECKEVILVWVEDGPWNQVEGCYTIGTYRWHLVKADPAKATGEREIVERLRGYNPPGLTLDVQSQIAADIQDAANEIQALRDCLGVDALGLIPNKPPVAQAVHVCEGCTTPALLCPNGNDPKDRLIDCYSKNLAPPVVQAGKDEGHTSCENKYEMMRSWVKAVVDQADAQYKCGDKTCTIGKGVIELMRNDLTPQPPQGEDAPNTYGYCSACCEILSACVRLGMKPNITEEETDEVIAFIRDLHARAREGYSAEEIETYILYAEEHFGTLHEMQKNLNDPQSGLAAVTKRNKQQKG